MTYSTYSQKRISFSNSFNLKKLYNEYQTNNSRLLAPLLCWCYLTKKQINDNTLLTYHLEHINQEFPLINEDNLLLYLEDSSDEELQKFKHSFLSENLRRDETEKKNNYRNRFKKLQKKYHLSTYKLCQMANANPGNFNAFYNHNQNDKLSLKKCRDLLWKLKEYSEIVIK